MSIIFGIQKPSGQRVEKHELLRLASATGRYAPDGTFIHAVGRIGMAFQPYHTTERSRFESQPATDRCGNSLVFDGRLDNYGALSLQLNKADLHASDSSLVLAAFERWGEECFSRLTGDWALALWAAQEQVLYLARDHAGARSLYFTNKNGSLHWSTYLETFFEAGEPYSLDEEYAAQYLCAQPIRDLTPYKGIRAVPPAHYLAIRADKITSRAHWNWMNTGTTTYKSDSEYEEHFFELFRQSNERRTVSGCRILAHLSGGMDSSSIVCMSDHIRTSQQPTAELLDTVSFYDDSEPNWNERPYFSLVETQRNKQGIHIEASFAERTFEPVDASEAVYMLPGGDSSLPQREKAFEDAIEGKGYRAILSGIGGDEVLGGVPTGVPELADFLIAGRLFATARRATEWCLGNRTPVIRLLWETTSTLPHLYCSAATGKDALPAWIQPRLRKVSIRRMRHDVACGRRLGRRPSSIINGFAWWSVMESLPHIYPTALSRYEYRCPYLDKDLVNFLFSIPREQVVRPRQRRSLMRRALKGIVPAGILDRRRKAFLIRGPLAALQDHHNRIDQLLANPLIAEHGFIDPLELRRAAASIAVGKDNRAWPTVMQAIHLELWLRSRELHASQASAKQTFALYPGATKLRMDRAAS